MMPENLKYEFHSNSEEDCEISKNKNTSNASSDENIISDFFRLKENDSETWYEKRNISDFDSVRGRHLTPDDVVRVVGQWLFQKARKTILHQQKIFSCQIFELHRLINVQRLLSGSPHTLHEKRLDPNKPHIKSPPTGDLLGAKIDPLKRNSKNINLTPNLLTTSISTPSTDQARLAPWFFTPPIGNQWLVPIKSPYEGLIYKPYTLPCFPTNDIILGNQLGQNYGRHYTSPMMNASGLDFEADEPTSEKGVLALFPTSPVGDAWKDENDDKKSRAIKVVPHSRKLGPTYAARIFEALKEEREVLRL